MIKHVNSGSCEKCQQIIYEFPEPPPHPDLIAFFNHVVSMHRECHVAYMGRGREEQEEFFAKGTSRAHFSQSPHNYNLAIDFFRLTLQGADWNIAWFDEISKEVPKFPTIEWGGTFPRFPDRPHFQIRNWLELVKEGKAHLVEPMTSEDSQPSGSK